MKKSILAIILTLALLTSLLAAIPFSSAAADGSADADSSVLVSRAMDATILHAQMSDAGNRGTGPTGVEYVNPGNHTSGDAFSYAFDVKTAGNYDLWVLYNSADSSVRYYNISVNGGAATEVAFQKNSTKWGDNVAGVWTYQRVPVTFTEGENVVKFSLNGSAKGPMLSDLTASLIQDFAVGTAQTAITLLPENGTPSDTSETAVSQGFKMGTAHDVTYWSFGNNGDGRTVTYTFDVDRPGDYYLAINYNNATGNSTARMLTVTVNGAAQTVTTKRNTNYWGDKTDTTDITWSYYIVKVTLVPGSNTLVLGMNGTNGAPMLADLQLWPASEWLTSADTYTASGAEYSLVQDDTTLSAFDGACFNAGNQLATVTWNVDIPTAGVYKVLIPYSSNSDNSAKPFSLSVAEREVALFDTQRPRTTYYKSTSDKGLYGDAWLFVSAEEIYLPAGENVPVTLSCSGGAYLNGVRFELVKDYLQISQSDLTVTYSDRIPAEPTYYLDITWENDDVSFDYDGGSEGTWNPQDHTFEGFRPAEWKDNQLKVTVVNHSNVGVKATLTVVDADADDDLTVTPESAEEILETAEEKAVADADFVDFVLTVNGTPKNGESRTDTVATATLSFAKAE